jgi:hypothetical protein
MNHDFNERKKSSTRSFHTKASSSAGRLYPDRESRAISAYCLGTSGSWVVHGAIRKFQADPSLTETIHNGLSDIYNR